MNAKDFEHQHLSAVNGWMDIQKKGIIIEITTKKLKKCRLDIKEIERKLFLFFMKYVNVLIKSYLLVSDLIA